MKKGIYITIAISILTILLFVSMPVSAGTLGSPSSSAINMHIAGSLTINGEAASAGDEVAVYDSNGNVVGVFVVEHEGVYGDMNISGDYSASSEDEGADEGEDLIIKVWQASTETLFSADRIDISAPAEGNTIYSPYTKSVLQFEGGSFYLLDIQAK
jgi:hypothetical protein